MFSAFFTPCNLCFTIVRIELFLWHLIIECPKTKPIANQLNHSAKTIVKAKPRPIESNFLITWHWIENLSNYLLTKYQTTYQVWLVWITALFACSCECVISLFSVIVVRFFGRWQSSHKSSRNTIVHEPRTGDCTVIHIASCLNAGIEP